MFVHVRVTAGARRETVEKCENGTYRMTVKEKAERNAANDRVIEILVRELGVTKKSIRFVSGHHTSKKLFQILP